MANITPTQLTSDGTSVLTFAAATGGGDTVINAVPGSTTSGTVLAVNNGGGSSINVTLAGVTACNLGVVHNPIYAVPAGKVAHIPIPPQCINASNQVGVTYSGVTSVTVAAYRH